jgi:hypothetical protein
MAVLAKRRLWGGELVTSKNRSNDRTILAFIGVALG